jgi:AhpD family alkylhydroperoxidase
MKQINPTDATGATKAAFDEAKSQFGGVINLFKVAGNAPNVLSGLLALNRELGSSSELDGKLSEQVAMLVSALNRCDYCVNVHMQVGKARGLSEADMLDAMVGKASGEGAQALLRFTDEVVRRRGLVSDTTMARVRAAGFSDKALLETIGIIGLYTTLQYIRHVGHPDQDFPIVESFDPHKHGAPGLLTNLETPKPR